MWFPNRLVQAQNMAGGWKFWIDKVEELPHLCSENKDTDQLHSYCEADLRAYVGFLMTRIIFSPR